MNKRIQKLAKQAGFGLRRDGEIYTSRLEHLPITEDLAKFAESIVMECAEQIIAKGTDWVDFAPSQTGVRPEYWDMAQQIKQHFGVEE